MPPTTLLTEQIFVLPGRIPHSPQRLAGTVGLVCALRELPIEIVFDALPHLATMWPTT